MGPTGGYPFSLDFTKRIVQNQNLARPIIFGAGHYSGREASSDFLLLINDEVPDFYAVPFLAGISGRLAINYVQNVTDGARCLTQLGSKIEVLKGLRRLARHSQGWQSPHTFSMESSKGYWGRCALSNIDPETGGAEYRRELPKVLASFGVSASVGNKPTTDVEKPKPKCKGKWERKGWETSHRHAHYTASRNAATVSIG